MEYRLDKNTKTKLKKILIMLRKIYNINGIDEMEKKLSLTLKKVMKIYYLKEKNNKFRK